jgi:hypothetical protein
MNGKELMREPRRRWKHWLGTWWICWFGIIGGFLMVGVGEFRYQSASASHFSLALIIVTMAAWLIFFVADDKIRKRIDGDENRAAVVDLLSLTGTLLAAFTLLGIGFFVSIAPRLR